MDSILTIFESPGALSKSHFSFWANMSVKSPFTATGTWVGNDVLSWSFVVLNPFRKDAKSMPFIH